MDILDHLGAANPVPELRLIEHVHDFSLTKREGFAAVWLCACGTVGYPIVILPGEWQQENS